jgi:hypothetical protein
MFLGRQVGKIGQAATLAMLDRYPRIAFIHVPKCAGSSISKALHGIYPAPLRATRFSCKITVRGSNLAARLLSVDPMICRQSILIHALRDPSVRFVTGHVCADPGVVKHFSEWKFITVLREPTARFISEYVFSRYKTDEFGKIDDDFAEFLDRDRSRVLGSMMTRYLSGRSVSELEADPEAAVAAALDNLDRFFSVGFVGDLENWALRLGRALGRKVRMRRVNPTPNPAVFAQLEQSSELRDRVEELCAIDRQFYARAQMRFKEESKKPAASPVSRSQPVGLQSRVASQLES